jgi:hypothetical protein
MLLTLLAEEEAKEGAKHAAARQPYQAGPLHPPFGRAR